VSDLHQRLGRDKVRLGIACTLWWNDDFPSIDAGIPFGQCVSEMALAGFEGCTIGHKYPKDPVELEDALRLRGLRVSEPWTSTYFTIQEMQRQTVAAFKHTLKFIKRMGGTDMVVAEFGHSSHLLPIALFANRPVLDDRQWKALTAGLNKLGKIANNNGMRLCYHHHLGTGVMTREEIDRLMRSTDANLVHLLLDTGHLALAGDEPLQVVKAHAGRIKHVHLKDVRPEVVKRVREKGLSFQEAIQEGVFTVPGDGSLDFVPILEALADAEFQGWLVVEAEQDPAKANPLEYAIKARSYLRGVLGW
jgi:inosose dehydratase